MSEVLSPQDRFRSRLRRQISRPRPVIVPLFLVINAAVFFSWRSGLFLPLNEMAQNFLVSAEAVAEGRYWTLLTSVFSHNMFLHFLVNMLVLQSFGGLLEFYLGRWRFVKFYLVAGVLSSISHCWVSAYLLGEPALPALGASGALAGLILVFALLFPKEKLLIFGLIPVPAIFGAIGFVLLDLWGLSAQAKGGGLPIGHGAHLGGAFTGVLYYFFFLRPKK